LILTVRKALTSALKTSANGPSGKKAAVAA